ncbi:MAG TPA: hypothetical protein VMZ33_03115, partial [Candidatus Limnocylindrales bacterium]|nr:hypothetical protein [Candidatus Limnocylindrales bacterium]
RWYRLRDQESGWRKRAAVNGLGAATTAVVAVEVAVTKFFHGAWVVLILIPLLIAMMLFIKRQYASSAAQLAVKPGVKLPGPHRDERAIVPVSGLNRAVVQAVNVGRSIADDVLAVLVSDNPEDAARLRERWEKQLPDVPLIIVESPYRTIVGPLLAYLDVLDQMWPAGKEQPITFVVIPEFVARHWWERLLYNQSAARLRRALLGRAHTVVVNVPYRREETASSVSNVSEPPG